MNKSIIILIFICLVSGCKSDERIARLNGVWVVDVEATMFEYKLKDYSSFGPSENRKPENLKKDKYIFKGNQFTAYRWFDEEGKTIPFIIKEHDKSSVTLLLKPANGKWTTSIPSIKERINAAPLAAWSFISRVLVVEFVDDSNARLYGLRVDAKGNLMRTFMGIHINKLN